MDTKGCFSTSAIVNKDTRNTRVQIPLQDIGSFPLYIEPEMELLDHTVVLFLICEEPSPSSIVLY